jgi:hypothetical protein
VTADLLMLALEDARNAALRVKVAIEKERELKAGRPTLVPLEMAARDLGNVIGLFEIAADNILGEAEIW